MGLGLSYTAAEVTAQANRATLTVVASEGASGFPVANALVTAQATELATHTDSAGRGRLSLAGGFQVVSVQAIGYESVTIPLNLHSGDSTTIAVTLNAVPPVLAPVRTTEAWTSPWLREFEERRRTRSGYFATEAHIRAAHGSDIGTLLQANVPGVRIGGPDPHHQHVYSLRGPTGFGPSGRCQVAVYLDGQRSPSGNVAEWPLSLLGGIEYYSPSTAPVRFREPGRSQGGSAACGVILLWTRP